MLKIKGGESIEIRGTKLDIMVEVIQLLRRLIEIGTLNREDIDECVKLTFMSNAEIVKETEEKITKETEKMKKAIEQLFSDFLDD